MDAAAGDPSEPSGIAVIGMACRLPGAPDIASFWRILCAGREGLTRFTAAELRAAGVPPDAIASPDYVPVNGVIPDPELFDAIFFGMNPREASITDPQHRIFLELVWQALESSGHEPPGNGEAIGVYAGCGSSTYLLHNLWPNWRDLAEIGDLRLRMGNGQEYLATRVSYKLNLRGPSVSINTACSTSLVAVHLACDSLLGFQCDLAVAGGVSVQLPQVKGYRHEVGGILSPDGRCRAFDADAQGTISGNGGAVVVLRRLADALEAGDPIYAVIRGSAINNDGSEKAGFTAPSPGAQRRVIQEAHQVAAIDPAAVGYVEAHGTGTPLGDPVEFAALTEAFRAQTDAVQFCALGSLKTNFGHLDEAAGVTGLIKAVLCLHRQQVPPTLHFRRPNPELAYWTSPFYVNAALQRWEDPIDGLPRVAGVSSFGIGGTNAHVVLQEAPIRAPTSPQRPVQLLPISAATLMACKRRREDLAACLLADPGPVLADVAHTLQVGRREFPWRTTVLAADFQEAVTSLASTPAPPRLCPPHAPPVVFMFSGQGTQYPGMAAGLYDTEPGFRRALDCCIDGLRPHLGFDLRGLLLTPGGDAARLRRTQVAQPALFAVEFALARLWEGWGIRPAAMIGHSLGELVALCLSGVIELESALAIVAHRGRLMQDAPTGAMLAVPLSAEALSCHLDEGLDLAAVNTPDRCSVAGPSERIEALAARLHAEGVETTRLQVSHAFHSQSMAAAAGRLAEIAADHLLHPPRIPTISNVSGDWLTALEVTRPAYFATQMRRPVQFARGIERLLREMPDAVLLEMGPGATLSQLARRCGAAECYASLPAANGATTPHRCLMASVGALWEHGVAIDWAAFAESGRRRVALPTYPFAREPHWVDPPLHAPAAREAHVPVSEVSRAAAPSEAAWCYRPTWRPIDPPPAPAPEGHWLLLGGNVDTLGIAAYLRAADCGVTRMDGRTATGESDRALEPISVRDLDRTLSALAQPPTQILWLWSYGPAANWKAEDLCRAFVALLQALDTQGGKARLTVIASGVAAIRPGEAAGLELEKGVLPGLLRSAAIEFPEQAIRLLDVPAGALADHTGLRAVVSFCGQTGVDTVQAWRDGRFWRAAYDATETADAPAVSVRKGGAYLITGGLGGIGLSLADALVRNWDARVVLLGRTALPAPGQWSTLLADPATPPALRHRLDTVRRLQAITPNLLILQADVSDRAALAAAAAEARGRFGSLHGVIHAAGIAGGALLARSGADDLEAVLAPKVGGLRALVDVLRDDRLDFCVLCSALSAETGAGGQAAYCAANSFLDLFAEAAVAPWPVVSVGWDAWRDVGMAAWLAGSPAGPNLQRVPDSDDRGGGARYRMALSAGRDWMLTEHRVGDQPVLPGTAYLDLACTGFRDLFRTDAVELGDVEFLRPFAPADGEPVELTVAFQPQERGFRFTISTWTGDTEVVHAQGDIAAITVGGCVADDDPGSEPASEQGAADAAFARRLGAFGAHWQCSAVFAEPQRRIAEIALPAAFANEVAKHTLHPALLDLATGFPVLDRQDDAALLPAGYRRVRVHRSLPARVRSRVRSERLRRDGLELDLELRTSDGVLLVEIEGYHLRRTHGGAVPGSFRLLQGNPGEIASLQLVSSPRSVPPPGMVEIEVHAAGLNFKDVLFAAGLLPNAEASGWRFGLECAGRIARVGPDVRDIVPSQPVVAYAAGCLTSHVLVPQGQVLAIPTGLSFADAATLPAAFTTALHALTELGRVRAGETVLIHAAAGGVGLAATQIALSLGAEVLATAGSEAKRDHLAKLGVSATFSSRDRSFVEGVRKHTNGRGVDVVLNSLSGALMTASLDCLAPYGRFLELGVRDIHAGGQLELSRFAQAISFSAVSVGPGMPRFAELFGRVIKEAGDGTLRPLPYQIYPVARSCEAFEHMASARHIGKVVVAVLSDAQMVPAVSEQAGRGSSLHENETRVGSSGSELRMPGITIGSGVALFEHCLGLGLPRVLVSTRVPTERRTGQRSAVRPAPESETPDRADSSSRGSVEDELAAILQRLVGVADIRPDDDFFTVGGDSLIGAQFVAQASRRLGKRVTLRDLFEAPTIAGLAARVDRGAESSAPIMPAEARQYYPLSHAQQRLWILAQNPAASVAYNMSYTLSLTGELSVNALELAFGFVVARHESLRTAFVVVEGTPGTEIRDVFRFEIPFRDLRGEDDSESVAGQEIRAEALTPIALERPPLLRPRLLRLAEREHLLLVSLHHIVADGMSLNVLIRDLDLAYSAFAAGRSPDLPPLSIQYKDFAVWQRQQAANPELQADRAYWLEKLAGELPVLNLPTDRPRSTIQDFDGGQLVVRLGPGPTAQCHALCQRHGVTMFMLLVAALQLVLHEGSGDEEILLGTPVAGRDRPELLEQIGYYLNNVVLRGSVRRTASFAALLESVRVTVSEALAHQDYPFDLLLEDLAVRAVSGRSPLFDVQINLMPGDTPPLRLGALDVGGFVTNGGTTIFDLNFMFSDGSQGVTLEIAYSTALFDAATIAELGQRVLRVLSEVSTNPDRTVRWLCNCISQRTDVAERETFLAAALDLGGEL